MNDFKLLRLSEEEYQLGKLPVDVGSFILLKLIGAGLNAGSLAAPDEVPSKEPERKPTPEQQVRAICFAAFLRGLSSGELSLIQASCLKVVSRRDGVDFLPIMSDSGAWSYADLSHNVAVVMKLTIEVLVWNLSDFFSGGGLGMLMSDL